MRLMSIVTASMVLGATTGLSSTRASAQNCAAGSSMSTGTFTWTYETGSNRKSSLAYPNGATASWAYNNRGELTSVQNRHADGTAISTYDYTYDAAGRRISKNDERYGYNARSELTQATSISDPNFHAAYQFDDIGNRETSAEFGIRSGEYTYTANELNQYASIVDENAVDSAAPSDATFTPTYDADGNQTLVKTKTGIWQVTYNAENRPVRWTCGTTNLVMAFDRMGRRVLSEVQVNDAPVKTETYVYDGYTCILRQTTIHTNDAPTTIRDTFVWDPTEPVATRPLVWNRVEEKGSTQQVHPTAFYFQDGNKNVSDVVSATDETKAHYTYAPFGDSLPTGTLAEANPWRFSSEYADDELGCVYYNFRHYEPITGRWLSRDPIGESAEFSLYIYCLNGSMNYTDSYGLSICGLGDGMVCIKTTSMTALKCYKGLTVPEFLSLIHGLDDCSLEEIEFRGHGSSESICPFKGRPLFGGDVWRDIILEAGMDGKDHPVVREIDTNTCSYCNKKLKDILGCKLQCGAKIRFKGCNTSSGDTNLCCSTSEDFPTSIVSGYSGFAVDIRGIVNFLPFVEINPRSCCEDVYLNGKKEDDEESAKTLFEEIEPCKQCPKNR